MRIEKIRHQNSLCMPMQCKDWLRRVPYKGVCKVDWSINAKRAAKRNIVHVYKPNDVGVMVLVNKV